MLVKVGGASTLPSLGGMGILSLLFPSRVSAPDGKSA